jgi:hypothetical protein
MTIPDPATLLAWLAWLLAIPYGMGAGWLLIVAICVVAAIRWR